MRKLLTALLAVVPSLAFAQITGSAHDLTTSALIRFGNGGGALTACSYCHTAHHAPSTLGLWNRQTGQTTASFSGTTSTTAGTSLPQTGATVNEASRKCLSCHDGSTALNEVYNTTGYTIVGAAAAGTGVPTNVTVKPDPNITPAANGTYLSAGIAFLSSLQGSHPVSLPMAGQAGSSAVAAQYGAAATTGCSAGIKYCVSGTGAAGQAIELKNYAGVYTVECTSCHDAHYSTSPVFLRLNFACTGCHIK